MLMTTSDRPLPASKTRGSAGDGQSWATAFRRLESALAVEAFLPRSRRGRGLAGGRHVSTGLPHGSSDPRSARFLATAGLTLYGGFQGNETALNQRDWEIHETVLSGDLNGDDGPDFNHAR